MFSNTVSSVSNTPLQSNLICVSAKSQDVAEVMALSIAPSSNLSFSIAKGLEPSRSIWVLSLSISFLLLTYVVVPSSTVYLLPTFNLLNLA